MALHTTVLRRPLSKTSMDVRLQRSTHLEVGDMVRIEQEFLFVLKRLSKFRFIMRRSMDGSLARSYRRLAPVVYSVYQPLWTSIRRRRR